ncbi:ornithine cyclodeaminase family protein [Halopenitus persicus]|uniref:Ornithine cyclodeaminase/alanine dehydrogenase n=1 Tax=Halopenitus persicus TaxID=1048396 RepID=A0A1H3K195_9EURY|nr:ornithine cyclodeaminase family protein [Halopenitus persicus]SDY45990.1 ornithine cyclodeaminase/alanine dehydrogenase [Halopenitus persicus]
MATTLYSKDDVQRRIDLKNALEVVERTYAETARNKVLNPPKLTMHLGDDGGWPDMNAFSINMPAYVDWLGVAGTKWAVATWDADGEMPISSRVLLFDLERGEFKSVMEGMYLTGVRTALQSVVGLKHLAPTTPRSIGVLGAGFQAEFQLRTVDRLTGVDWFRLFDVDGNRARTLAARLRPKLEAKLTVSDDPEEAVGSDAVLTVTNSKTPVLEEAWLADDVFIVGLGSYRELPDESIRAADHIVVDDVSSCLQRGVLSDMADRGDLTRNDVDATIGEVLVDDYTSSVGADHRVLFVPIGMGSLDVALAEHVQEGKSERRVGTEFAFE